MRIKKGKTVLDVTEKAFRVIYQELGFKKADGESDGSAGTENSSKDK